ncbi:pyruvate, water dikinase regulatory protein [Thioalkalivibrio paradoxus]|uniref:pyruvate, water dikinase regulatory protein n=1 Tax=Thioalkalivibrio paradoxus TaxID=108010 RepID=UPI00046C8EDA|nr:pyruvate, phosphate dikinase/phosphoenolpyruvate synthase regulator [Thioalkalivibrio paradoxus]
MVDAVQPQIYLLSDGTGITAETLARTLITQFEGLHPGWHLRPFVRGPQQLDELFERMRAGPQPALAVATFADAELRQQLRQCPIPVLDIFSDHLEQLEQVFGRKAESVSGRAHGIGDIARYDRRIEALNFTLAHDDGLATGDVGHAEVVLMGVSRSGKTPTCLYLAMNYGMFAANYPLIPEDLRGDTRLPGSLRGLRNRLLGLVISPERLADIREGRRPGSRYASLPQCRAECLAIDEFLFRERIPRLDVTHLSVEEIATRVRAELA